MRRSKKVCIGALRDGLDGVPGCGILAPAIYRVLQVAVTRTAQLLTDAGKQRAQKLLKSVPAIRKLLIRLDKQSRANQNAEQLKQRLCGELRAVAPLPGHRA